jgi:hypothetical protein
MNTLHIRSIAAVFMVTLMSGCVSYPNQFGPMGYQQGYRYAGQVPYGNYGYRNHQRYQPYREQEGYREQGHHRGDRGYGRDQHHDND